MKEKFPTSDQENYRDSINPASDSKDHLKRHTPEETRFSAENKLPNIEELSNKVKEKAKPGAEATEQYGHPRFAGQHKYNPAPRYSSMSTLTQAQRRLTPSERQFSKFIHNPKVEAASDLTGGSIARPSGLLWGGIFSFMGSLSILIICRYYGYEYSYFIALAGFGGGFVFGLLVEAAIRPFKRRSHS